MDESEASGKLHSRQGAASTFAAGRYRVLRVLGEGGQKVVYLVHDVSLDRECALSLLKPATLNPEALRRFEREARAMARLQGETHVVDVYDLGEEDGAPFLVSEYVPGGDLRREVRDHEGGLSLDRIVSVGRDIAAALAAAHHHGIIHRDVSASNVWRLPDGRCKLGDFGLAAGADGAVTAAGGLVGTAAYMAPEQALGQACDARSDLYSLGVVLYEMATGKQPFAGDDPIAVVAQHINTAPVAPSWHKPQLPPALEALILALLAKVPEDRPRSAAAVIEALDAVRASTTDDRPISAVALNPLERLAGGVFVGRDAELRELRAAVEAAIAGQRQLVFLVGEPGIGKTRLSEQLATYAKLRRAEVRWGRCVEGDGAPAFWPWLQILRSHADAVDDDVLRADLGDQASLVAQVLPELASRLGFAAEQPTDERARFDLFEAIGGWLCRSANRNPLVLVLDDLHWADEPSLLLLEHLASTLRTARVLIAGTFRDAEVGAGHPLMKIIDQLPRLGATKQIALRGLDEQSVASYIELATGNPPPPKLAATVYRQTEGNALFVGEVVRMLTTSGAIDAGDDSWTLEIPSGVRGVIGRRLASLAESCRALLNVASVIGREFELRVLERVSEADLGGILVALDEALAARLVVIAPESPRREGRYLFSHALVRDTLYDDLATERRLRLHARIAAVLEELYGVDPGPRIGMLAHHFREAAAFGDASKAIEYSIRAGDAAQRIYAYEECIRQWDAAITLMGEYGRVEEQAQLMQRAADVMFVSGVGLERGIGYLERALDVWERTGNQRQQASAHSRLGRTFTTYPSLTDLHRAERHLSLAIDLLPSDRVTAAHGYAWIGLASAQDRMLLPIAGLESARRAKRIGKELGISSIENLGLHLEGGFLAKLGHNREGSRVMDQAWEVADRAGDPVVTFYSSWTRGSREMHYRGNPRAAIEHFLKELARPNLTDAVIRRTQLNIELAYAYLRCGDRAGVFGCDVLPEHHWYNEYEFDGLWEDALVGNTRDLELNQRAGNRLVEGMRSEAVGLGHYHVGRLDEATELFAHGASVYKDGDVGGELRLRGWAALASAECGDVETANDHLARCDEIIECGDEWLGQIGSIELARAASFVGCGELSSAFSTLEQAIGILHRYGLAWDEAEAFRVWGRALRSAGDERRSVDKFQRAIDIYRRIGAGSPYIARIVKEYASPSDGDDRTFVV